MPPATVKRKQHQQQGSAGFCGPNNPGGEGGGVYLAETAASNNWTGCPANPAQFFDSDDISVLKGKGRWIIVEHQPSDCVDGSFQQLLILAGVEDGSGQSGTASTTNHSQTGKPARSVFLGVWSCTKLEYTSKVDFNKISA